MNLAALLRRRSGPDVVDEWKCFEAFHAHMGSRPADEPAVLRLDPTKKFGPGNCRSGTLLEWKRQSQFCRPITYNGKTRLLSEWASGLGISIEALRRRLANCERFNFNVVAVTNFDGGPVERYSWSRTFRKGRRRPAGASKRGRS